MAEVLAGGSVKNAWNVNRICAAEAGAFSKIAMFTALKAEETARRVADPRVADQARAFSQAVQNLANQAVMVAVATENWFWATEDKPYQIDNPVEVKTALETSLGKDGAARALASDTDLDIYDVNVQEALRGLRYCSLPERLPDTTSATSETSSPPAVIPSLPTADQPENNGPPQSEETNKPQPVFDSGRAYDSSNFNEEDMQDKGYEFAEENDVVSDDRDGYRSDVDMGDRCMHWEADSSEGELDDEEDALFRPPRYITVGGELDGEIVDQQEVDDNYDNNEDYYEGVEFPKIVGIPCDGGKNVMLVPENPEDYL